MLTGQGRGQGQQVWSVLLIDIGHFKAVNDMCGHLAGDEVLKAMMLCLGHELRESDVLGRWGGEDFLALLPATGFEGALVAAERLRRVVSLRTFPYAGGVTVSIGVASHLYGDTLERGWWPTPTPGCTSPRGVGATGCPSARNDVRGTDVISILSNL